MLRKFLLFLLLNVQLVKSSSEDEEELPKNLSTTEYQEFEPVNPLQDIGDTAPVVSQDVPCHNFTSYSKICNLEAALIYNASKRGPPMPLELGDWCKAIRHLTECAILWNTECRDVTDSHFDEDSITGHEHVLKNVCNNDWFLTRYTDIQTCIDSTSEQWDYCYGQYKEVVDYYNNSTYPFTHYIAHFHLCCARAKFRRCTLETFLNASCNQEQTFTLQRFSVVLSEGDVSQNCDQFITYEECPGGDPRPKSHTLLQLQLQSRKTRSVPNAVNSGLTLVPFYLQAVAVFHLR